MARYLRYMPDGIKQSGSHISIKIISLTDIDVSGLFNDPLAPSKTGEKKVGFFEIHNMSGNLWEWRQSGFQFVTTDGDVIEPDMTRIDAQNLPEGWHSLEVDIPPSNKAKVVVILGQIYEKEHDLSVLYEGQINKKEQIDHVLYKKNLAEAWYSALSDDEIRNYSDKFEEIKLDIPDEKIDELDKLPDTQA